MKIQEEVLSVLQDLAIKGNQVAITQQLPRNLYLKVNAVLNSAGGKWDKKAKAHLFPGDIEETIEHIIQSGEITTPASEGFFSTPPWLAQELLTDAEICPDITHPEPLTMLEPSAGTGSIALLAHNLGALVTCVEKNKGRAETLEKLGLLVYNEDFLEIDPPDDPTSAYDRIVTNPPFAKQADIKHVTHALKFLKPGGLLVSVMSAGVRFRQDKTATDFRNLVEEHWGTIEDLPKGSFKQSGTMVNTVKVVIPK